MPGQGSAPVYRERTDYMGNTWGSGTGRDMAVLLCIENGQIIWVTPGAVEQARTRQCSCIQRWTGYMGLIGRVRKNSGGKRQA